MYLTPKSPPLRRWRLWFGAIVVAEIGWFALMRPPFAGHFGMVVRLGLIPVAVVGYVYLLGAISVYLDERDWDYRMRQLIVAMLGSSVGFFLFALMTVANTQLEGELGSPAAQSSDSAPGAAPADNGDPSNHG